MDARGLGRVRLAGAAAAGAAAAHTLLYLVAVPDTKARAAILAESGHGYWSWAVAAALVLGVVSALATAGDHFRRGLRHEPAASRSRTGGDPSAGSRRASPPCRSASTWCRNCSSGSWPACPSPASPTSSSS